MIYTLIAVSLLCLFIGWEALKLRTYVKKYEVIVKGSQQILTYLSKTQGGINKDYIIKRVTEINERAKNVR